MAEEKKAKPKPESSPYSPEFLEEMRQILLQMKRELLRDVSKSVKAESDHLKYDVGDFYDHASQDRERELALTLSDRERERLFLINDALRRIDEGTYGICEVTGEKIGEERLRALPFTKLSVEAQEELEKSGY
jgi:DnaK suppressor protein